MTQQERGIMSAKNVASLLRGVSLQDFPEHSRVEVNLIGVYASVTITNKDTVIYSGHTNDGKEWFDDTTMTQYYHDINQYHEQEVRRNAGHESIPSCQV